MVTNDRLSTGFIWRGGEDGARFLESLPIDSLWVGGHVASPTPTNEAIVQLAMLSAHARRVRVGTSVLLLPLYQPAVVAKQILDLDRATNGRITLGVGVGGEYPQEFRACEIPIEDRGRRTDEAISLLRSFWSGETVNHRGRYFQVEDVRFETTPVQVGGPPLIVAGRKLPAMRRAAALGDGWMPYLYSSDRYADAAVRIRDMAASLDRDLAGFEWFAFLFVSMADDERVARNGAKEFLGGMYRQDFDAFIDRVAACGTPSQVAERIQAFVDAGARHLIFSPCQRGDEYMAVAAMLMEQVMPTVRVV